LRYNLRTYASLTSTVQHSSHQPRAKLYVSVFIQQKSGKLWVLKRVQYSVPNKSNTYLGTLIE